MTSLPTPARQRDTAAHATPQVANPLAAWRDLTARRAHPSTPNRHRPSDAQLAILDTLRVDGEQHIGAIARAVHRDRTNIARHTLPHLEDLGLIARGDVVVLPGGGRPAQFWHLTATGRRIADVFAGATAVAA